MNKTKVTFQKVTSIPKDTEEGRIYFNEETNSIYLGDSDTAAPYSVTKIKIGDNEYSVNNGVIELPETDFSELNNKVDKEEGKVLSSNDFTTSYKEKLDTLDTALSEKQNTIQDLDTIRENATNALQSETDPIFSASPASSITEENLESLNNFIYLTITENKDDNTFECSAEVEEVLRNIYNGTEKRTVYINSRFVTNSWFCSGTEHFVDVFINEEHNEGHYGSYTLKRYWFYTHNGSKDKTFEYKWIRMKAVQDEVSDPSADGEATSFIDTISQDRYGVITVTKKNIPTYTEQFTGTVTGVKINDETKSPTDGIVDLGTVLTEHQSLDEYAKSDDIPTKVSDLTNDIVVDGTYINNTNGVITHITNPYDYTQSSKSLSWGDGFVINLHTTDPAGHITNEVGVRYKLPENPVTDELQSKINNAIDQTALTTVLGNYAKLSDIPQFKKIDHGTSDTGSVSTSYQAASDTLHIWGEINQLYVTLKPSSSPVPHWIFEFTPMYDDITVAIGEVEWIGGDPYFLKSRTYQISVINGKAAWAYV